RAICQRQPHSAKIFAPIVAGRYFFAHEIHRFIVCDAVKYALYRILLAELSSPLGAEIDRSCQRQDCLAVEGELTNLVLEKAASLLVEPVPEGLGEGRVPHLTLE